MATILIYDHGPPGKRALRRLLAAAAIAGAAAAILWQVLRLTAPTTPPAASQDAVIRAAPLPPLQRPSLTQQNTAKPPQGATRRSETQPQAIPAKTPSEPHSEGYEILSAAELDRISQAH